MSAGAHPVLDLQSVDTLAEQLRHRRDHLTEIEVLAVARRAIRDWEVERSNLVAEIDSLQGVIDDAERRCAELDVNKARLASQLRTVIAPREAEALQAEMANIDGVRSELDDAALAALEEQSDLADRLDESARREDDLRRAQHEADEALTRARTAIDAELTSIDEGRDALRAAVEPELLARYDRLRRQQVVAAARLDGPRCTGCHLDLSAAEVDEVRSVAAGSPTGVADCPHCGRILVV